MKHNIEQLLSAYIFDNKDFIKESGRETVAEYILEDAKSLEGGFYWFLSDEEASSIENDPESQKQVVSEITEYINDNYTCRDCHGSGYITDSRYPWRTNICSECDGRGWYTVEIKKSHTLRERCE